MPPRRNAAMLPPGSVIGIFGGGQLGRMLAIAAAEMGMACHIYAEEEDSPAAGVAPLHTRAGYDDLAAVGDFARNVDVITYEFENIPLETLQRAAEICPVLPSARSLEITRDRLTEKRFLREQGLATAPFAAFASEEDLQNALGEIGLPAIVKTRRLGYDGKGQYLLRQSTEVAAALAAIGDVPAIVEGVVNFSGEASVVLARSEAGEIRCFDVIATRHEGGILRRAECPAGLHPALEAQAQDMACSVADALGHVGVLAVEFFLLSEAREGQGAQERLLVNEIAPRVHNSGHWTPEVCPASQFEQHIRAICGWPLGDARRYGAAVMVNLIGADTESWAEHAAAPDTRLHLYGKREIRAGRKMGHIVRVFRGDGADGGGGG